MKPFTVDITKDFKEACSKLSLGELVVSEKFNSFTAMTAIPLMDPVMDTGMEYTPDTWTLDEAAKDLDLKQLVGLVDALFVSLLDHLNANERNQYAEYLLQIVLTEAVLAREIIKSSQIFFEEDFFPDLQGLDFAATEYDVLVGVFESLKLDFLKLDSNKQTKQQLIDRIEFHLKFIEILQTEQIDEQALKAFSKFDFNDGADMQNAFDYKFNRYLFTNTTPDQQKLSMMDGFKQWRELFDQLLEINRMKTNYTKVTHFNTDR
ncbi:N-alpha-acetyltransferase 35 NatC auxiliary subunit [Boothiomyces macroporosus]|uniref:N-alpha-acetyltransferase 35 NatC auxiliary subunit n=1 Tax=Boothiomyces macroporosus TaxID=261099 RepID=A0AAD5UF98_9FUNG|nr:N-alpha-acetyltransferase 35 NatC auxiliary subunit [Boothiomyces macroporosus]